MVVKKRELPKCPVCGKDSLANTTSLTWSQGYVVCMKCGYLEGKIEHLGTAMFPVDPLPTTNPLIYYHDSDQTDE